MTTATDYEVIPLGRLQESKTNPRRTFDKAGMAELAENIRQHGVLQPLLVRVVAAGDGTAFEIVCGARRFRAAKQADLVAVPCIVREFDDKQALEVQFIENLQRQDLHPLDEGLGYKKLHEEHGYSVEQLAAKLGKSKAYVYGRMQLGKLPVKAQTLFFEGKIDASHALLIARIPVPELVDKAAKEIAEGEFGEKPMSFRDAAEHVRRTYQLDLTRAPFPTGDKKLLPDVGACGPCPKRLGNQQTLFGAVDGKGRANVCTDPKCFEAKSRAHIAALRAEISAKGGKLLEGRAADTARYSSQYVRPGDRCNADPKRRTYKQLAQGQKIVPVMIAPRHAGDPVEKRWSFAEVGKALKANGYKFLEQRTSGSRAANSYAETYKREKAVKDLARSKALPQLVALAEKLRPEVAWRLVLRFGLCGALVDMSEVCVRRDLKLGTMNWKWPKATAAVIEKLTLGQLQGLAIEILTDDDLGNCWEDLCEELGVDEKKLVAAAKAEQKAKAKAEAAAAKQSKKAKGTAAKKSALVRGGLSKKQRAQIAAEIATAPACRVCGCTEDQACDGGCSWVEPDLCSSCVRKEAPGSKPKKKGKAAAAEHVPDVYAGSLKGRGGAVRAGD